MQALLRHISTRLQGLGDRLSAAKDRLGHFLQDLAAKIRNDTCAALCLPLHPPFVLRIVNIPGHSLTRAKL